MEAILFGVTVVSLVVALIMSVTAWRLHAEEKRRAAARVAALSIGASTSPDKLTAFVSENAVPSPVRADAARPKAPWTRQVNVAVSEPAPEIPLNEVKPARELSHAAGFLGAASVVERGDGSRQRSLAMAAVVLFVVMSFGLVWMMSAPRGTTAVAMGPNSPLELVSLRHDRQNQKLAVSGLVRNPATAKPVERLSAVVFLFDRQGAFVASGRANVDFLNIGSGDESPFVVSLDAPGTVARYRVSFRTDEGLVPHIDKRGESPIVSEGEQPASVSLK